MQAFNSKVINILFISSLFVALGASVARYMVVKQFPVHIEVVCDPYLELCFHRNCEEEECPLNELSNYRQYDIEADVFNTCSEIDGCEELCKSSTKSCTETICDPESDTCSGVL